MRNAPSRVAKAVFLLQSVLIVTSFGCAVHYFDEKTQTEHLWGFGHMRMKASAPNETLKSTVTGTDLLGIGFSNSRDEFSLVAGLSRRKNLEVMDEDSAVRLEWPDSSFFNVRIGSKPPFEPDNSPESAPGSE